MLDDLDDIQLYNEWRVFHEINPRVYDLICSRAAEALHAGHTRYAIATIWELIRWKYTVETTDLHFKMPNNHRAYYSRLWLQDHPQHPGFFRTAELRSQRRSRDRYGRTFAIEAQEEDLFWDTDT